MNKSSFLNKMVFVTLAFLGTTVLVKYSGIVGGSDSNSTIDMVEAIRQNVNSAFKSKNDLTRFSGFWIPIDMMGKFRPSKYILALAYLEDDNVIGEFEGPAENYTVESRWIVIKEFDYDKETGVLTIDFAKNNPEKGLGSATFLIDENDHLFMTNQGGTFEFFRATEESIKKNYQLQNEEYERKAKNMPLQKEPTIPSVIPPGDTSTD